MTKKIHLAVLIMIVFLMLGCATVVATPATGTNETQVAMQVQLTVQAGQQATMAAQLTQQSEQPAGAATQIPQQVQPTALPPQSTAAPDIQTQMANSKILIYEDTVYIGEWIQDALDNMGLQYTQVYDAVGDFMANLDSGIQWDLIIVGAESKGTVQGEFWDVISGHINGQNKTALIAEIWYLDLVGEGRIKPVLTDCGITYQRDWPQAEPIYWLDPSNPVFNEPNTVLPFLHYNQYWGNQSGDLIRLIPGSDAILLAGTQSRDQSSYGVMASCFDGRVIFQTFSNHDYHQDEVLLLWENYITYVLTNHYAVQP